MKNREMCWRRLPSICLKQGAWEGDWYQLVSAGQKAGICDPEPRREVCFGKKPSASEKVMCYGIFLNTNLSQVFVLESRNTWLWSSRNLFLQVSIQSVGCCLVFVIQFLIPSQKCVEVLITHFYTYFVNCMNVFWILGFPGGSVVKNPHANAGNVNLISGSGKSADEGNGNPLYSCLENPVDRGVWWVTVHGVAEETDTI